MFHGRGLTKNNRSHSSSMVWNRTKIFIPYTFVEPIRTSPYHRPYSFRVCMLNITTLLYTVFTTYAFYVRATRTVFSRPPPVDPFPYKTYVWTRNVWYAHTVFTANQTIPDTDTFGEKNTGGYQLFTSLRLFEQSAQHAHATTYKRLWYYQYVRPTRCNTLVSAGRPDVRRHFQEWSPVAPS